MKLAVGFLTAITCGSVHIRQPEDTTLRSHEPDWQLPGDVPHRPDWPLQMGHHRYFNVSEWELIRSNTLQPTDLRGNRTLGGEMNLCIHGHLAPEFLLIGAQKAGTTAFAAMLAHPNLVYPTLVPGEEAFPYYQKEPHIFDNGRRFAKGAEFWLSRYPECTRSSRAIAADFTPDYIASYKAPRRIKAMYGELTHRLRFAALLKNPTARIHSAFHFYIKEARDGNDWAKCVCQQEQGPNICHGFKKYVEHMLHDDFDPCKFLDHSDYATHLRTYLEVFDASQFMVFPVSAIRDPSNITAAAAVWKSLGIEGRPVKASKANTGSHASILDDLGPRLLEQFQSYITDKVGPHVVARFLVDNGIGLFGYESNKDPEALAVLLSKAW
eukprot:CAMPEP_0168420762 /NCGR_PEP_ID=MMETSP0228-20121227/32938_1 /TAXON_ID=133427 /ORGANISM="Protoceratium reticulatum, Strain CCCM 535 (=CCMP 1889)" /LENGTH=381 /DNA_ID=CAMNT_0008434659 /DNA_START=74 /DNA_END=1219 /DNA_ORIENTATION=-